MCYCPHRIFESEYQSFANKTARCNLLYFKLFFRLLHAQWLKILLVENCQELFHHYSKMSPTRYRVTFYGDTLVPLLKLKDPLMLEVNLQLNGMYSLKRKVLMSLVLLTFQGAIIDGTTPNMTINEYENWRDTVKLLKMGGAKAYRFSIAWARLIPKGIKDSPINPVAVKHYNDLIDQLIRDGIVPMVTLYHFDAPQVLVDTYGSVLNTKRFTEDYVYFADNAFRLFGDRVKHWGTFNEPISSCVLGNLDSVCRNPFNCCI